jgi:hypothetical protein
MKLTCFCGENKKLHVLVRVVSQCCERGLGRSLGMLDPFIVVIGEVTRDDLSIRVRISNSGDLIRLPLKEHHLCVPFGRTDLICPSTIFPEYTTSASPDHSLFIIPQHASDTR